MNPWIQAGAVIGISAALSAGLPRRWLLRGLGAWLLSPAIFYFAVIAWELATLPPIENAAGKALFGFMLIATIAAIPWLVLCLLGIGIGWAIRRRRPNRSIATPSPPPSARDSASGSLHVVPASAHQERFGHDPSRDAGVRAASAPTLRNPPTSDWRVAHVGFAGSGLAFHGEPVWSNPWRRVSAPPLQLADPNHPSQIHSFDLFDIGPIHQPLRFAASELSNGVWCFYLPPNPPTSRFDSADGSLRIEQRFFDPHDAREGPSSSWAVILDASSRRVLVDCVGWAFSHVVCNADGTLDLRLQSNGFDSLMRIDPIARSVCDIGEAGPTLPLSSLARIVEDARRLTDARDRTPGYRRINADGSIRVDLQSVEWSNSHWVNSPRVIETHSGRVLLDLWATPWDAAVSFPDARRVELGMRRYGSGIGVALELDFQSDRYRLHDGRQDADASGPIEDAVRALEAWLPARAEDEVKVWHTGYAPGRTAADSTSRRHEGRVPGWIPGDRRWQTLALMFAAALAAIALVAFVARGITPPARHKLDHVPPMPHR